MHPRFGTNHFDQISQLVLDRIYQSAPPIHVEHSHPAYMTGEVPLSDEISQDSLIKSRGKNVRGISSGGES
jgi:hypothetical protein